MVYQPMLELLDYLRANGFKTFIVSGGGIDFTKESKETAHFAEYCRDTRVRAG